MEKESIIILLFTVIIVIGGYNHFIGFGDFYHEMQEVSRLEVEIQTVELEFSSLSPYPLFGTKQRLLDRQYGLLGEQESSLNRALRKTDNKAMKEYISLILKFNQEKSLSNRRTNDLIITRMNFERGGMTDNEYNNLIEGYKNYFSKSNQENSKLFKKVESLLDDHPGLLKEINSYGLYEGIYIGQGIYIAHLGRYPYIRDSYYGIEYGMYVPKI